MSHQIIVSRHTTFLSPHRGVEGRRESALQARSLPASDGFSQWHCIVNSIRSTIVSPIWGFCRDLFRVQTPRSGHKDHSSKKRHSDPPAFQRSDIRIPKRTSSTNLMAECSGSTISLTDPGYEPDNDVEMQRQRRLSDPHYDTVHEKYRIFRDSPPPDMLENESALTGHPENNRPFYSKREIALYKATLLRCSTCKTVIPVGYEVLCEQNERFCTDRCLKRWRFKMISQAYRK